MKHKRNQIRWAQTVTKAVRNGGITSESSQNADRVELLQRRLSPQRRRPVMTPENDQGHFNTSSLVTEVLLGCIGFF